MSCSGPSGSYGGRRNKPVDCSDALAGCGEFGPDAACAQAVSRPKGSSWELTACPIVWTMSLRGFEDGLEIVEVLAVGAPHSDGHEGRYQPGEADWLAAVAQRHLG